MAAPRVLEARPMTAAGALEAICLLDPQSIEHLVA